MDTWLGPVGFSLWRHHIALLFKFMERFGDGTAWSSLPFILCISFCAARDKIPHRNIFRIGGLFGLKDSEGLVDHGRESRTKLLAMAVVT